MSGKVVGWAFDQRDDLSAVDRYVLVAYADNADHRTGKCWPDRSTIIDKTGLSRTAVYRSVSTLKELGYLVETEDEKGRDCIVVAVPWSSLTGTDESLTGTDESLTGTESPPEGQKPAETSPSQGQKIPQGDEKSLTGIRSISRNRQEPSENLSAPAAREKKFAPFVGWLGDRFAALRSEALGRPVTADPRWFPELDYLVRHGDREANAGYQPQLVADVIAWIATDDFWPATIRNPEQLTKHFEQLLERSGFAKRAASERHRQPPSDIAADPAADAAWESARKLIEADLPASAAQHWIAPIEVLGRRGEATLALAASPRGADWLRRRYLRSLEQALGREDGPISRIEVFHRWEWGEGEVAA